MSQTGGGTQSATRHVPSGRVVRVNGALVEVEGLD